MTLDLAGEHAPSLPETASLGASAGRRRSTPRAHVVAVVLARDGAARLPRVLAALAGGTRPPDALVGVDLGSRDDSATLLAAAMPLLALPRRATAADAVEAVLAARAAGGLPHGDADRAPAAPDVVEWIWLVPHEAAPAPDALEQLLLGVETAPSVGVAGCKQVSWDDDQRLLDVGFTASPLGVRVTGLDRGEVDQGQHDGRSDVLAVSGAGMLVRRDVWEELGGLDPDLGPAAADLDLCRRTHLAGHRVVVVPSAVVARATPRPARRAARRAALHLRLAATPLPLVPVVAAAVLVGGLLHALALLLAGRVGAAGDELAASVATLARPLAWRRTRRRQARARRVPPRVLRRLRPPPDLLWRQRYDGVRSWLTPPPAASSTEPPPRRARGAGLPLLLAVVAGGVASRGLLDGRAPASGSFLPVPGDSGPLWSAATSSWREVGLGVRAAGDPYPALLAVLGVPFGDDPARAATVLLVGALPLAALTAWVAASALTRSRVVRTWAALAWAAAPPLLFAVRAGHTSAVLAHVLLPLVALLLARAAGLAPARRPVAAAARLGLVLTALLAAAPSLALPAVAVLLGSVVAGRRRAVVPIALAATLPAVLLLPWWVAVWRAPRLLLTDPALAAAVDGPAPGSAAALRALGVPGPAGFPVAASLVGAGLVVLPIVVAAVLGPLRRSAGGRAAVGWWAAGTGVAVAAACWGTGVAGSTGAPLAGLPGPGLSLALAGFGAAALLGADVAGRRARRSAYARQARGILAAGLVTALGSALAAAAVAAWSGTPAQPQPPALPAVARAEALSAAAARTLVLQVDRSPATGPATGSGTDNPTVRWSLVDGSGPDLGDASAALAVRALAGGPADRDAAVVLPTLAKVLAGGGRDPRPALEDLAVGSVVLLPPADAATVLALDAAPGLERFGDARGALLWRVAPPSTSALLRPARARVVDAAGDSLQALPWRAPGSVTARVDPGPAGRLVVLAQRYDTGWHATLDGAALTPVRRDGWGQAFALPPAGGRLEVTREEGRIRLADPGRAAALAFALLVAVPLPRLRGRGTALPPPRASRPLPRPAPAPDDLVPAPPPQVFDDEHPEDATRPLYVGPLLRRRRRRLRLGLRLGLGRRNRKETR